MRVGILSAEQKSAVTRRSTAPPRRVTQLAKGSPLTRPTTASLFTH